jgi:hypothetical protein
VQRICRERNRPGGSHDRLRGYIGWLRTDPAFLEATVTLERQWRSLPEEQRPPIAHATGIPVPAPPPDTAPVPDAVARFLRDFRAACDRWSLIGFATWDLPRPQGPHLPCSLPTGSPLLPRGGLHLSLPTYYPLTHGDDLLRQVRREQKLQAQQAGLDPGVAGLRHHKTYSKMLDVLHTEGIVTTRYPADARRLDRIAPLIEAIAEHLGLSVDSIKRLRKRISARRRGT